MDLKGLECKKAVEFFERINKIPRGSGNEKGISDFLVDFAKDRGLEVFRDEALNVLIRKPASKGYENRPAVIIQGHMDMVCEKNAGSDHDFLKDPIDLVFEGDFIRAKDTTLGADDGIAVAYALAILDDDSLSHSPLEVLITTDEEVGMGGARAFDTGLLKGRLLLNIDSEVEGVFTAGCAGGARAVVHIPLKYKKPDFKQGYRLVITGLKGGHSGVDIDKERANANLLLARALSHIQKSVKIEVGEVFGGSKDNAIPREAFAYIAAEDKRGLEKAVYSLGGELLAEYAVSDPDIRVYLEETEVPENVFEGDCLDRVVSALLLIPCGIVNMSGSIKGLPETSNNIGSVRTDEKEVVIVCAMRSAVETRKAFLKTVIDAAGRLSGGYCEFYGDYPAWEFKQNSYIRELAVKTYEELYGKKAVVDIIHAGLECGLFGGKCPELDMISMGPAIIDIHSPNERLSLSSCERTYKLLIEILKKV